MLFPPELNFFFLTFAFGKEECAPRGIGGANLETHGAAEAYHATTSWTEPLVSALVTNLSSNISLSCVPRARTRAIAALAGRT